MFNTIFDSTAAGLDIQTTVIAAGVALGVAVFYALPARNATTPLEVKLTEYQEDMEKTEGRDIEWHPRHPHRIADRRNDVRRRQLRMDR